MAPTRKSTRAKKAPSGCQSIKKFLTPSQAKSKPDLKVVTTEKTIPVPAKVTPKAAPSIKRKSARTINNPVAQK